jgi:hypothetical protein
MSIRPRPVGAGQLEVILRLEPEGRPLAVHADDLGVLLGVAVGAVGSGRFGSASMTSAMRGLDPGERVLVAPTAAFSCAWLGDLGSRCPRPAAWPRRSPWRRRCARRGPPRRGLQQRTPLAVELEEPRRPALPAPRRRSSASAPPPGPSGSASRRSSDRGCTNASRKRRRRPARAPRSQSAIRSSDGSASSIGHAEAGVSSSSWSLAPSPNATTWRPARPRERSHTHSQRAALRHAGLAHLEEERQRLGDEQAVAELLAQLASSRPAAPARRPSRSSSSAGQPASRSPTACASSLACGRTRARPGSALDVQLDRRRRRCSAGRPPAAGVDHLRASGTGIGSWRSHSPWSGRR